MNFNPRAPCGARQGDHLGGTPLRAISIHAPRAGRDLAQNGTNMAIMQFQSTRPMRGATRSILRSSSRPINFNPRAPCGARPRSWTSMTRRCDFNPRAPCGARQLIRFPDRYPNAFQSTRPMRGATGGVPAAAHLRPDFNPRAPCGARLAQDHRVGFFSLINPRAPCGARPRQDLRGHLCGLHFNPRAPCGARLTL